MTESYIPTAADSDLMQKIHALYGEMIESATRNSALPPAFLAAVIANESGGEVKATRYEHAVFEELKDVILGRKPYFEGARRVAAGELLSFINPGQADPRKVMPCFDFAAALSRMEGLAKSYSLTQIMGYHTLDKNVAWSKITTPGGNLEFAVQMFLDFAAFFRLDPATQLSELFHCWNTGDPKRPTADPLYAAKGLARTAIYREILNTAAAREQKA